MFDNTNHYELRVEEIDNLKHYFVSFKDGQADIQETEISRAVYLEFCKFIQKERNLRRYDERHIEQSELNEETLHKRALYPSLSVEDSLCVRIDRERLKTAIEELPETQRRRLTLYYFNGLTFAKIAEQEGCSHPAIMKSVKEAIKKIKKYLED